MRPRYARDLMWDVDEPERPSTAQVSTLLPPVPSPPRQELDNQMAQATLNTHPDLFDIVTPVNVDAFTSLLDSHPNQPFVTSVVRSLREGFWPWANTVDSNRPPVVDNSLRDLKDPVHLAFMREQRDEEVRLGRFSAAFGTLQPGMTCVPLWVVPKPRSDKLRLVVDHSAGSFSPNSYIPHNEGHAHLDTLHQLGTALLQARQRHGRNTQLTLFKSDVSQAYRRLPVHFLWQLHQIVCIDNYFHVDRNNDFGNRAAGRVWFTFFSLVLWIAVFVRRIPELFTYVDDTFSWDLASSTTFYAPYNKCLPTKQARFLSLLDDLSIPHEERKQVHGSRLDIIGFTVDANAMTVEMPAESRTLLIEAIHTFANPRQRRTLRDCQRIAGWINWALNAYPLLRPGLSALYEKTRHGIHPHTLLSLNTSIVQELRWVANHLEHSPGIHIFSSQNWHADEANLALLSDACPSGMGFWLPKTCEGFQCPVPASSRQPIFFLEALAVLSALHHVCMSPRPLPARVALYTDNMNTVAMFNTLSALPAYNPIILTAADWLLRVGIQIRVFHLPRRLNSISTTIVTVSPLHLLQLSSPFVAARPPSARIPQTPFPSSRRGGISSTSRAVADALSRFDTANALLHEPRLLIRPFTPPRFTLGASAL
jgi:hypothetical protein